ncbi:hypothetical protein [Candidatus Uabimicrobium sp. HlEnr_7]|uniref:hypothetical protein n=1 Tax=Candidatus Uabimicrobium helgolandensis TaxID=3095367 RepID=UPI003556FC73
MKKLTTLLIILLSITYADEQQQQQQQIVFVGTLVKNEPLGLKNPSEYCLEDGHIYKGAKYRIAGKNIHSSNPQDLSSIYGKTVIVYGKLVKDLNKILTKGEKAPEDYGREQSMMQIRSDWVTEETGFSVGRSTKKRLKRFSYIEYSKVEEFKGLQVEKSDNIITVTLKNTFENDIKDLSIIAHYEVVFGKPSPRYTTNTIDNLYSQQSITITFPTIFSQQSPNRRQKRAAKYRDIIITATAENFHLNIRY